MYKRWLILSMFMLLSLTGCGKEEVIVEAPYVPMRAVQSTTMWDGHQISAITPVTAFESKEDTLLIFPYNDSSSHIKIEKIIISQNDIFSQMIKSCSEDNIIKNAKYTLCTLEDGTTCSLIHITEDKGYLISTKLPSSYCGRVCELLCQLLGS